MNVNPTSDKALIGAAGVHLVAYELSLRDLIALSTIRNTAGIDIVAVSKDGTWHANLQVKTSRSKVNFWPISNNFNNWIADDNFLRFRAISQSSIKVRGFPRIIQNGGRTSKC